MAKRRRRKSSPYDKATDEELIKAVETSFEKFHRRPKEGFKCDEKDANGNECGGPVTRRVS